MKCDYCGDIDPANPGQSTADTVLCIGCTREAAKGAEPDHIVSGPPDDEDDEDDQMTPLEDRSTWPTHEPDMGEPVGEYDDARNLNAADITAEIRRMS